MNPTECFSYPNFLLKKNILILIYIIYIYIYIYKKYKVTIYIYIMGPFPKARTCLHTKFIHPLVHAPCRCTVYTTPSIISRLIVNRSVASQA